MIKRIMSIVVIMSLLITPSIKASIIPVNSSVYNEGIYKFDDLDHYQSINIRLINNKPTNFTIFDENYNIKISIKLDSNTEFNMPIKQKNIISIVGDGEIAISFIKKE